jgi:superfamily I DNA and RNA helicase
LADLWTYLGANRAKLSNFANHRNLLSQVANYRSAAAVQVGGTLVQLEKLASDLDDLRERVATPLLAEEASIPLEVHIMTLRKGVDRLSEKRRGARNREEQVLRRIMEGSQYLELPQR